MAHLFSLLLEQTLPKFDEFQFFLLFAFEFIFLPLAGFVKLFLFPLELVDFFVFFLQLDPGVAFLDV